MEAVMKFEDKLKHAMKMTRHSGLSLSEAFKEKGVKISPESISYWRTGDRNPSPANLYILKQILTPYLD